VLSIDVLSKGEKCEKLEKIVIHDDFVKSFQVRAQLSPQKKEELIVFLKRNINVLR